MFFLGLQGKLPSRGTCRAIMVGSVLVIAAATANGLYATVPKDASAAMTLTNVGTEAEPEVMAKVTIEPADLIDADPAWVQITAWQGGGPGVVTDRLTRTGDNTWESTKPVPVGGTWKTLLRVQDGRMLAGVPIFLPADEALDAKEIPASASFTRDFVPEIEILQRERKFDAPAWIWGLANFIVLMCSIAVIGGTAIATARVSRSIAAHESDDEEAKIKV